MDKEQYTYNKAAKTGALIACPVCGRMFTKKQYSQAFCSTECKDAYWAEVRKQPMPDFLKKPRCPRFIKVEEDRWLNTNRITFLTKNEALGQYFAYTGLREEPYCLTEEQFRQLTWQ